MNALIQEILKLRADVDELKHGSSETGSRSASSSNRPSSKDRLEHKLGSSVSHLIGGNTRQMVRPWLNAPGMKRNFVQWLGVSEKGFGAGLIGGLWSLGVSALMSGIANLFKSNLAPLIAANDPESVNYINQNTYEPYYKRSFESELIRGRGAGLNMRENVFLDGSLERQIRRGVVGL